MNPYLIYFISGFIFGSFCAFIAKEKNRDTFGWFILGFFFTIISLLALIAVPKLAKEKEEEINREKLIAELKNIPRVSAKQRSIRLLLIFFLITAFFVLLDYLRRYF